MGTILKTIVRICGVAALLGTSAFGADGVISGVVKDASGSPFRGAFVRVRNPKNRITVDVLSDPQGRYQATNLAPGVYDVAVAATGYSGDPHNGVNVAGGAAVSLDFSLNKRKVQWSELTSYQGEQLLPDGKGKELLVRRCFACHQFQTRIAAKAPRTKEGWAAAVKLMRVSIAYRMQEVTDQDAEELASYLEKYFGPNSQLPSPSDMPGYAAMVRPVTDEALKMVYVDYEVPGANRFPWSANPDNKGVVWTPYFGAQNRIAKLNIATGEVQDFKVPFQDAAAGVHATFPAPDGSVWFAEQGANRIGEMEYPVTGKMTEFVDSKGRGEVTVRVNAQGDAWASGTIARLEPKTGEYTHYPDAPFTYSLALDKEGNAYFSSLSEGKSIGRIDQKTNKVTRWQPPSPHAYPRRMNVDSQGNLWFGEYNSGKMGRFDPKTEKFTEYTLPGPSPKPYALGIDQSDRVWYSSMDQDVMGCLDPKTGKIVEYPAPYSENAMREFFMDSEGRMWFGTAPNNRVGYFIPANY